MIRQTAVAGSFYTNNCEELQEQFKYFNKVLESSDFDVRVNFMPKAIIVPHAGYVYSGFTANAAYSLVKDVQAKRVVVIGPSHKFSFKGASISLFDEFQSPCGNLKIDTAFVKILQNEFDFLSFNKQVHCEHSTETQMPFIKYYLPNCEVVEIVYSDISKDKISELLSYILKNSEDTLLVISTDLSHFYDLEKANFLDNIALEAIKNLSLDIWNKGAEACGRTGVKAIIKTANEFSLKSEVLDYRTSYDVSNDDSSVVGYMSAILG